MATYIVKSKIQKHIQGKGKKVSAEVYDKLENLLIELIDEAVTRAEQNDRATVLIRDI